METRPSTQSGGWWDCIVDATTFWEPRRLVYNLILSAVAVFWLVITWPHFRTAPMPYSIFALAVLVVCANICYSAAYLVDLPLQRSAINTVWRHRRWLLWLLGMIFAIVLENYWIADEIYPSIR
jgi:hypothetical protein